MFIGLLLIALIPVYLIQVIIQKAQEQPASRQSGPLIPGSGLKQ